MNSVEAVAFTLVAGLTFGGLAGSALEASAGRPLSFRAPFVSPRRIVRSLAVTLSAGPYMLVNDAMEAWRAGDVSTTVLLSCGMTATAWVLASGVVVIDLARRSAAILF